MQGLQKDSKVLETIEISADGKTAKRYRVVEETIDLDALRKEKEALEAQLAEKEPSDKELLIWARENHTFFTDKSHIELRLLEIEELLN